MSGDKSISQACPQPSQLSITHHLHFSSSRLSFMGPSSLFSLVPSSSRQMGMTPRCLGHYSPPACRCCTFGRGSLTGKQQLTGALEKFKVLLLVNPQPTSTTSTTHCRRAGASGRRGSAGLLALQLQQSI